jgi:phenylacetate-CoA ligase
MVVVRGVNVFPSAIENVMREFSALEEFRIEVFEKDAMREIKLVLEPRSDLGSTGELAEQVSRRMRERIGLRPIVEFVAPGTLPRFELKARRFFKL